jgi:hypothetical protein
MVWGALEQGEFSRGMKHGQGIYLWSSGSQ